MATAGGLGPKTACQGLFRTVARPRARSRLLVRKPRWISSEKQARPDQPYSVRPEDVREEDRWLLRGFETPFKTIDQESIVACEEPVRLVDSAIECLCSWNEASGTRQAIYVPGDASRPRTASPSLSNPATREPLAPARSTRPWGYCNPGRGPRYAAWDDPLAALCATHPELKLDHVDVMITAEVLLCLMVIARNRGVKFSRTRSTGLRDMAFNIGLIDNTLVLNPQGHDQTSLGGTVRVPTMMPTHWDYYKLATESMPEVEDSSVHWQLLRYRMGPLSCLVRTLVHGTLQAMPTSTAPDNPVRRRDLHGIDVIKAGHGVRPELSFMGVARPPSDYFREAKRLKRLTPNLWVSGQTRVGFVDVVPAEQFEAQGGLTVVEMAELVRRYEEKNEESHRRLVGLLTALRDTVRARGAPCIGTFIVPTHTAGRPSHDYGIKVHEAGPNAVPFLLDWHKEHFWSQNKVPRKQVPPQRNTTRRQSRPQRKASDKHADAPKGVIRKLAQWMGF